MTTLGQFIRGKRELKNISLRKFAHAVGISPTMMSKVEHDHMGFKAGAETLKRIASILEVNSDELLALAGKVDPLIIDEITARHQYLPIIIRKLAQATDEELAQVADILYFKDFTK